MERDYLRWAGVILVIRHMGRCSKVQRFKARFTGLVDKVDVHQILVDTAAWQVTGKSATDFPNDV